MSNLINYTCPFCGHHSTLERYRDYSTDQHKLNIENARGTYAIWTIFRVCRNPGCKEFSLQYEIGKEGSDSWDWGESKNIIPRSNAKTFPDYIPKAIREDYEEACLIRNDSPKASATLCRRCLQGMIRDFHGITENRLIDEINALEDIIDSTTWQAIDAIRETGNIGAHMEKDVNVIIDVEPEEASKLIWLIETLMQDWYIAKHEKEKRLQEVIGVGNAVEEKKEAAKANNSNNQDTSTTS